MDGYKRITKAHLAHGLGELKSTPNVFHGKGSSICFSQVLLNTELTANLNINITCTFIHFFLSKVGNEANISVPC